MKFYEFPIYYYYMVIYSTTRDKPVLGEMREWDFVKCRQKGIVCIEGDRKTPPVACQWNTRLKPTLRPPPFSWLTPLPVDFSGVEPKNLFLLGRWTGWGSFCWNIYWNIIKCSAENFQNYKIFSIVKKFLRSGNLKIGTGRGRAFDLPLTFNEAKPFCYLIFCFTPSPASHANANNSHLILFHILLVRNILHQRGRFICE